MYKLLLGGELYLAPIPENAQVRRPIRWLHYNTNIGSFQRVLDIGTGTGEHLCCRTSSSELTRSNRNMGHVCAFSPDIVPNRRQTTTNPSVIREFADDHPSAVVIGTDLSPIQPTLVPPNLTFEIDDCCDEWMYNPESFDFIHVRGLYGCVADWDEFYGQALK